MNAAGWLIVVAACLTFAGVMLAVRAVLLRRARDEDRG